tara:strand:+ start:1090 stop:2430 length:1341 start_codon:yes stop_codon:yes gene_type:complete
MAIDYKKSGRRDGMTDDEFTKAMADAKAFFAQSQDIYKKLEKQYERVTDNLKEQGTLEGMLNGKRLEAQMLAEAMKNAQEEGRDITQDEIDNIKEKVGQQKKFGNAIDEILPGALGIARGIEASARGMAGILGPASMAVAVFVVLAKFALDYAKSVADTRKELGVSVTTAMKLNAQNKILGMQAKAYGLELEDIKTAQAAIRNDLGASVQEAVDLSLSFARTSSATGQTAEQLTKTLSIMESISTASRETLLNQLRSNAAMIEAAGVAPALVMRDIADNAEFFASFAKDGGQNLIQAGIAARKLGLDMSAVAAVTDSLLDFESSIESSMEASMLLGRQINTDRARMLALTGQQGELMKEVQRIVGGEAEFAAMNVLQRRALAKSVGMSVEQLARTVRGQTAGTTGAAAGNAVGTVAEKTLGATNLTNEKIDTLISVGKTGNRIMEG